MTDWLLRDFLVFEAAGEPVPAYTAVFTEHTLCGHVRAEDETPAAKAVAGVTRRVSKYAVVEVAMVDLSASNSPGHDLFGDVADTPHRAT